MGSNEILRSAPSDTADLSVADLLGEQDVAVDEAFEMQDCRECRRLLLCRGSFDIPNCSVLSVFQDFQSSRVDSGVSQHAPPPPPVLWHDPKDEHCMVGSPCRIDAGPSNFME
mmetsp:Transcript_42208/g.83505  ORF Transcript_42208/g.83505 Transcript_42208/m.83505 type:complete len:113 (-) Transcript_42208:24-362(-)